MKTADWDKATAGDGYGHQDECNCKDCHESHIQNDLVEELAKLADFECCQTEMENRLIRGEVCPFHGSHYMENKHCQLCPFADIDK